MTPVHAWRIKSTIVFHRYHHTKAPLISSNQIILPGILARHDNVAFAVVSSLQLAVSFMIPRPSKAFSSRLMCVLLVLRGSGRPFPPNGRRTDGHSSVSSFQCSFGFRHKFNNKNEEQSGERADEEEVGRAHAGVCGGLSAS